MGYDIGPRIGVTGEKEYNNQVNSINNKLKELGSQIKAVASEFEGAENSQQAITQKSAILTKQFDEQNKKLKLVEEQYAKQRKTLADLGEEVKRTTKEFGENSSEVIKAQTAYNKQETLVSKLSVGINETKTYVNKLTNEIRSNNSMLNEMEKGTRDAITGLDKLGKQASETSNQLEKINDKIDAGILMEAGENLGGVGDAIVNFGTQAYNTFSSIESASTKVSAYFNETGEAAERNKNIIKNVYESGVGDSMDTVANSVLTVKKNIRDLDDETLTRVTQQAITLEEQFGIDMNESMRGVNGLMVNFKMSATDAMDYLVTATQNGLDKTNELGDNMAEYAQIWSQAGFSAKDMFTILDNGLESGAYNLDKVNDFVKEFIISVSDGRIEKNLSNFSKSTQNMFASYKNGKATVKDLFFSVISDLNGATNSQKALTIASETWSALGEDNSLAVIQSLGKVKDTYNDVSGAAGKMYDTTTTPMQTLESNTRKMQDAFSKFGEKIAELGNKILPPITEAITFIGGLFDKLPGPVQDFVIILGGLIAVLIVLGPIILACAVAFTSLDVALLPIIGVVLAVIAVIALIVTAISNWGAITDWLSGKWNDFYTWITTFFEDLKVIFLDSLAAISSFFNETIPKIIDDVCMWFEKLPGNISAFFSEIIENVKKWGSNMIIELAIWTRKITADIITWFSELPSKMLSIGENIVKGLWEGIANVKDWIVDKIGGFVDGVVDSICDFFGIASPSRVMRDRVGKYVAQGVGVGIYENRKAAIMPMQNLANDIINVSNSMSSILERNGNRIGFEADKISRKMEDSLSINSNVLASANYQTENTFNVTVESVLDGEVVSKNTTNRITRGQRNNLRFKGAV